jgi:hypothetical protein
MDLKQICSVSVDWFPLVQDRDQWQVGVSTENESCGQFLC